MDDDLTPALAGALRSAREEGGLSAATLAEASGVSRAMISKIERGDSQPTAALLARLCAALGLTLSELVARAEGSRSRLARRHDQPVWTDPASGYSRRSVSPAASATLELVEVELPPGARVRYPAESYRFIDQQIWGLGGTLHFTEGDVTHVLHAGDCLQLGPPSECVFENPGPGPCRYLVAIAKNPSRAAGSRGEHR